MGQSAKEQTPRFLEKVIAIETVTTKVPDHWTLGDGTEGYHYCTNCGSRKTLLKVVLRETVRRIPNPTIYGENSKPSFYTRDTPKYYSCGKCGIRNESPEYVITPLKPGVENVDSNTQESKTGLLQRLIGKLRR